MAAMTVSSSRTILVVDDEESVRRALHQVLHREGYTVLVAEDGEKALDLLEKQKVHVLVSDQNMPGLSGIDLLKLVGVRHPRVVRIMITADLDPETVVRSINESEVYRFIRKPWNNVELLTIMHFAFRTIQLEEEKRKLIALVREQRKSWERGDKPGDPAGLEAELILLAEDEARGG
jgi:DNA-binding NtrC family response regulator